jgi:hypothetical protein
MQIAFAILNSMSTVSFSELYHIYAQYALHVLKCYLHYPI